MMKTDTNNTILEELQQVLSLEDTILGPLTPESNAESSGAARSAKKGEKKLNLNNSIFMDIITDQAKAKLVWQCVTACLVIFVIIASFVCFNLYQSRENLTEKLGEIKPLENQLADSKSEVDKVKADIIRSNAELQRSEGELNNSKIEIKNLQERLANVTQRLETLQNRNAEAVKLLNGRLQNLSNQSDTALKH